MDIQALLASFGSKLTVTGYSRGTKSGVSHKSGTAKPWHMILVADGVQEKSFMVDEAVARTFPIPGTVIRVTADHSERDGRTFLNNAVVKTVDLTPRDETVGRRPAA